MTSDTSISSRVVLNLSVLMQSARYWGSDAAPAETDTVTGGSVWLSVEFVPGELFRSDAASLWFDELAARLWELLGFDVWISEDVRLLDAVFCSVVASSLTDWGLELSKSPYNSLPQSYQ